MENDTTSENTIHFTPHQVRVIKKWASLKSSTKAAESLGIGEQTILTHLRRMRLKLGVKRTVDVYIYMVEKNLL